jgi:hypothetical protein
MRNSQPKKPTADEKRHAIVVAVRQKATEEGVQYFHDHDNKPHRTTKTHVIGSEVLVRLFDGRQLHGQVKAIHETVVGRRVSLWMTNPNMKASLYLKNGLKTDSVAVTPILYLSNGTRLPGVKQP